MLPALVWQSSPCVRTRMEQGSQIVVTLSIGKDSKITHEIFGLF